MTRTPRFRPKRTIFDALQGIDEPTVAQALADLLDERENFGGVPDSSPAWAQARRALTNYQRAQREEH